MFFFPVTFATNGGLERLLRVREIHSLQPSVQDRLLAGTGTVTVIGLFGYLLVIGLSGQMRERVEKTMALVNLELPATLAPHANPHVHPHKAKSSRAASPRNLKNKATEVIALAPVVPVPSPIIGAARVGSGKVNVAGASNVPGPGEGAGGEGNGTGSDGDGDSDGGVPPHQIKGHLTIGDLPAALRDPGTSRTVGVQYAVESDGTVSSCDAAISSGNLALDQLTCRLIQQRFRFRPSRDAEGRPVRSVIEESHTWTIDKSSAPPGQ